MSQAHVEIQKLWSIIPVSSNSSLELRAIWPKGRQPKSPITKHYHVTNYKDVEASKRAFENDALRLNQLGYNIYIVMNPIRSDFDGKAVSDTDIRERTLLLVDIDRAGNTSNPATDNEVEAARQLALQVGSYIAEHGGPDNPKRVMSGNGYHLYYKLQNCGNSEENKALLQQFLKNLAAMFDNEVVSIDTSVFNASRITKVLGTIARKGVESEERPYRMAVLDEA